MGTPRVLEAVTTPEGPGDKLVDFFVSYTASDLAWAQWIVQTLESLGYTTRYQDRDFPIGSNFVAAMDDGVLEAQATLAVLSPAYMQSKYCKDEWTAAHNSPGTDLVPVRIFDFVPEGTLGTLAYIDFVGLDESAAHSLLSEQLARFEASGRGTAAADLGRARYGYPARLHHVPAAPVPLLGRDDYLNLIEEYIEDEDEPVLIVPDVGGRAGRGCTALAADYVRSRGSNYEKVYWIHGSPEELLGLEYWRLGRELGLPPRMRTAEGVNDELGRQAARGRVLLVFDNAPARRHLLAWLPPGKVECIVTSTSASYHGERNLIELGPLSDEEAARALARYGRDRFDDGARRLADVVEKDPQAVALIAAYLGAVPDADSASLAALVEARREDGESARPLEAMKQVVLDALSDLDPAGVPLLGFLSFGAARPLPLTAFAHAPVTGVPALDAAMGSGEARKDRDDRNDRERALVAISRLGMGFVVQDAVAIAGWAGRESQRRLSSEERTALHTAAVRMFTKSLQRAVELADHAAADHLAAHLYCAIGSDWGDLDARVAFDAHQTLARSLSATGRHDRALEVVAAGLERVSTKDEVGRTQSVALLQESGRAKAAAGQSDAAIADLRRAAEESVDLDPDIAVPARIELGRLLATRGEPAEAGRVFDDAAARIADDAQLLGLQLDEARTEAAELADEFATAEEIADQRVTAADAWQGPGGILTTAALVDRGRLRHRLGRRTEAIADLEVAIGDMEKKAEDDDLAAALVELGDALVVENESARARLLFGRAAVIHAERRGRRSDEVQAIRRRIAAIYEAQGDEARASELRRLASDEALSPPGGLAPEFAKLAGSLQNERCTPILGPSMVDRILTPRETIAETWAGEYPMEEHRHRSLSEMAQYRSIKKGDDAMRLELKAHIGKDLLNRYGPGLPRRVRKLDPRADDTLEDLIRAAGAIERWCDPFEHHAVLAHLNAPIYVTAGASDLLRDALIEAGKEPRVAVCDWRSETVKKGAPESSYHYKPTPERPLVVHIFGHLRERGSVILTESDHIRFAIELARGMGGGKVLPSGLIGAMSRNALLILGFRLQSWEFHVLFQALIDQPGVKQIDDAASVAVNVSDETGWIDRQRAREYVQSYFKHRGVDVLWDDLDAVIKKLSALQSGGS